MSLDARQPEPAGRHGEFKGMVLLAPTHLVATLSLRTGRTTILRGAAHLVILADYLFTTIVP